VFVEMLRSSRAVSWMMVTACKFDHGQLVDHLSDHMLPGLKDVQHIV
jgi:hypothetical protein